MNFNDILYSVEDSVATITLNRPEQFNTFSDDLLKGWVNYLEEARDDDTVNVIVITGSGKAFCAGGDVAVMEKGEGFIAGIALDPDGPTIATQRKDSLMKIVHRVAYTLEGIDKPVICAINGPAMGAGLDMALMCDIRVVSDKAIMGESYVKMGLVPGDGGAYFLPRLVGLPKALEMLWFGDIVKADEALRLGLVTKVFSHGSFDEEVKAYAERLAKGPQLAVRMIKRAVYSSLNTDMRTALDMISSHMAIVSGSADHKEAVNAFFEKRDPNFQGK